MKLQPECVSCLIAQVKTISEMLNLAQPKKVAVLQETMNYLDSANYDGCTPESMGELWEILMTYMGETDPYAAIKSLCNREAMKMIPSTQNKILLAKDPLDVALKYAIAGNLIDYGLEKPVSIEEQNAQIDAIARTSFVIDDSALLRQALGQAKTLLYLGDNAGEIVFDKLLIQHLLSAYTNLTVSFAVKGTAVLNDVTRNDALEIGMGECARIIENGDGSPGTVLPRTNEAFRQEFAEADVVLSKGQGNFESLGGVSKENLFFLFTAKCGTVCNEVGVPKLSIVCMKNRPN